MMSTKYCTLGGITALIFLVSACGSTSTEVTTSGQAGPGGRYPIAPPGAVFLPEENIALPCPEGVDEVSDFVELLTLPDNPSLTLLSIGKVGAAELPREEANDRLFLDEVEYSDRLQPQRGQPTRLLGRKLLGELVAAEANAGADVIAKIQISDEFPGSRLSTAISLRPDGGAIVIGPCGQRITDGLNHFLDWLKTENHPIGFDAHLIALGLAARDRRTVNAANAFYAAHDKAARPTPWLQRDPERRTIDPVDGPPAEAFEGLIAVQAQVTLPADWARQDLGICPRQSLGWLICFDPPLGNSDEPARIDMWLIPNEPVDFYLADFDRGPESAQRPFQSLDARDLIKAGAIELKANPEISVAEIQDTIDRNDTIDVLEWSSAQ